MSKLNDTQAEQAVKDACAARRIRLDIVMLDRELTPFAKVLAHLILMYTNNATGVTWAAQELLEVCTGYKVRQIRNALNELKLRGHVTTTRKRISKKQRGPSNVMCLVPGKEADRDAMKSQIKAEAERRKAIMKMDKDRQDIAASNRQETDCHEVRNRQDIAGRNRQGNAGITLSKGTLLSGASNSGLKSPAPPTGVASTVSPPDGRARERPGADLGIQCFDDFEADTIAMFAAGYVASGMLAEARTLGWRPT